MIGPRHVGLGEATPGGVRVWVATAPVDMRKCFDSLAEVVRAFLGHDPLCGHLFVFRNRAEDRMKILFWDRSGFCLFYKRLEKGRFADLTGIPFEADRTKRWRLGAELYETEVRGIVFHRPDLPGIRAVTVFDQGALGRAVQSDHFKFVWNGEAVQKIGNFSTHDAMDREELFASLAGLAAA